MRETTLEAEVQEERQASVGGSMPNSRQAHQVSRPYPAAQSIPAVAAVASPQQAATVNFITMGFYTILVFGGVWASIDLLRWCWRYLQSGSLGA